MPTLVTGGLGFIGSHLVKRLIDQGREVVIFDISDSLDNLSFLGIDASQVKIFKVDLSDYQRTLELFKQFDFDSVFHLAARVGGLKYLHENKNAELITLQENLSIDSNVFRACLQRNISKIIYTSSIAVYSIEKQYSLGAIFKEEEADFSIIQDKEFEKFIFNANPDGGYGLAKAMGELQLNGTKDPKIGIARLFNIYGPNLPLGEKSHVITDLFKKISQADREITIWGGGDQTRDFLYIDDCLDALLAIEEKIDSKNIVVNIGSGKEIAIKDLAQTIINLSKKEIGIICDTTKPVGPVSRTADISRAKEILNWKPKISIQEGLGKVYQWYKK